MKPTLRSVGLVGTLLFGSLFWFTFGVPGGIESVAKEFIKERIEIETGEKIDTLEQNLQESRLGKIAKSLLASKESEITEVKDKLRSKAYEHTASVIAEMSDLSCECRKIISERLKSGLESRLTFADAAQNKIRDFLEMKYMEVVNQLTTDLRIFTGSNLLVFLVLLVLSFAKPAAIIHLFLPGVLLFVSTSVCSFFYIFEQNWFFTIIYNDYLGYLGYVGILFGLLCDIAFNKARITTEIINMIFEAIGSALSVAPC